MVKPLPSKIVSVYSFPLKFPPYETDWKEDEHNISDANNETYNGVACVMAHTCANVGLVSTDTRARTSSINKKRPDFRKLLVVARNQYPHSVAGLPTPI